MPKFDRVTSTYEHALAYTMHKIDKRGLLLDREKKKEVNKFVVHEIKDNLAKLSGIWNCHVYIGVDNALKDTKGININSSAKLPGFLKDLGYKLPKIRKKNEDGDYEFKESVAVLACQMLLADPSLWPGSGKDVLAGEAIKTLMYLAKLKKFKTSYLNALLYEDQYFCNSNVAATVTGRRGTKKNIFGYGGNNQNFPARGKLSDLWRECIIARPGKVFLFVDQVSAEDWPVQALSANYQALEEMRNGVNRHYKFAHAIFGRPIDELKRGRANHDFQCEMEYYLGKKGRHANNYGMQPARLSEGLAAEGYSYPVAATKIILDKINEVDPNVRSVFHEYIRSELFGPRHTLTTPFGRERQFFGLRPNEKNYSLLNEAYAQIPQSTVGDNTGIAIVYLDDCNDYVLQESHDSICQELPDNESELIRVSRDTEESFNREITFYNGIRVRIPIEAEIGYSWGHKVKVLSTEGKVSLQPEDVSRAYKKLKEEIQKKKDETYASSGTGASV